MYFYFYFSVITFFKPYQFHSFCGTKNWLKYESKYKFIEIEFEKLCALVRKCRNATWGFMKVITVFWVWVPPIEVAAGIPPAESNMELIYETAWL
jgi:hypothetical protein